MTGADIIAALLRADPTATALVPADSTKLGRLPDGIPLPAFQVATISKVERQTLKRGAKVRRTDRVRVTVRAANYRSQVAAIDAAVKCCAGRTGSVAGGSNVSILTAGTGPDLNGPANSFEQAQDFRVSFDAVA